MYDNFIDVEKSMEILLDFFSRNIGKPAHEETNEIVLYRWILGNILIIELEKHKRIDPITSQPTIFISVYLHPDAEEIASFSFDNLYMLEFDKDNKARVKIHFIYLAKREGERFTGESYEVHETASEFVLEIDCKNKSVTVVERNYLNGFVMTVNVRKMSPEEKKR